MDKGAHWFASPVSMLSGLDKAGLDTVFVLLDHRCHIESTVREPGGAAPSTAVRGLASEGTSCAIHADDDGYFTMR
jgi:hypothetical protein